MIDPTKPSLLRAGPLDVLWSAGDLRYIRMGGREVIRRLYAAVRDRDWGTVPGVISDLEPEVLEESFRIRYTSTHRQGSIHFVWNAEITGEADGTIRFAFDGEAKSTFLRNRIGCCVLHPIRECAGVGCRAIHTDGTEQSLAFPDTIAAEQPVSGLHDLAGLQHEIAPGLRAELQFEGDAFEMEDQRNWIDASFKTYGTPLRLPFPVEIAAGTRVRQQVTLRIAGHAPGRVRVTADLDKVGISICAPARRHRLPALGLGWPSHNLLLHETQVKQLRVIRPAHFRVDVQLWEKDWAQRLKRADSDATDLSAKLEVALHLNEAPGSGVKFAAEVLGDMGESLAHVIIFHRNRKSTTPEAMAVACRYLGQALQGIPLGSGTDGDLYQLNLQRPPADADFISWSMNPQVHACDDASIAETPEAAAQQVASVRRYFPGLPLHVSPVTLRPRFNPNATGSALKVPPDQLPPQVDPRQASLFGAGWTLAMIKALAEAGADSMTFYETSGWRGVMETAYGSPLPEQFPSIPGAVFPLYHVLADAGDFAGGEVVATESNRPLELVPLLLRKRGRHRLILANLSAETRRATFPMLAETAFSRLLDSTTMHAAMTQPEAFRAGLTPLRESQIDLPPHAIASLDFAKRTIA